MQEWASANALILAIPPGGILVAKAAAEELELPCTLYFVQTIEHPETGERLGGISWRGRTVWDRKAVRHSDQTPRELRSLRREAFRRIRRRSRRYNATPTDLKGRIVILVDDGTSGWPALLSAIRELRMNDAKVALAMPMCIGSEVLYLVNEAEMLFCPSVGSERRAGSKGGYWGRPLSEPEGLTAWFDWTNRGQNTRNAYHTVSCSSGISYDR
jgi:predicted phosphoribosyltransferase